MIRMTSGHAADGRVNTPGNRSAGGQELGDGGAGSKSGESLGKIVEGMAADLPAGLGEGQHALDEAKPVFTLTAEATLPPQHGLAQRPLGRVVGRLDRMLQEGPQERLQLQQLRREDGHLALPALRPAPEEPAEARAVPLHAHWERFAWGAAPPPPPPPPPHTPT